MRGKTFYAKNIMLKNLMLKKFYKIMLKFFVLKFFVKKYKNICVKKFHTCYKVTDNVPHHWLSPKLLQREFEHRTVLQIELEQLERIWSIFVLHVT